MEDLDFSNRIEDGGLFDILKQLGLLKEYTGGAQAAVTTTNLNDVQTVAKLIACEAGANKLDELLVGAVLVNRWKDEQGRFGSTLIEVISQGNGKQYSTWASGAFQNGLSASFRSITVMWNRFLGAVLYCLTKGAAISKP